VETSGVASESPADRCTQGWTSTGKEAARVGVDGADRRPIAVSRTPREEVRTTE